MRISDLTLSRKGLILVSVPLVFGLLFVICLGAMLHQAEMAANQDKKSKAILSEVTALNHDLIMSGYMLFAFGATHNPFFMQEQQQAVARIPLHYASLKQLTADDPEKSRRVADLEQSGNRILFLTSRGKNATAMLYLMDRNTYAGSLVQSYQTFLGLIQQMVKQEEQVQRSLPGGEAQSRTTLYCFLGMVLIVDIILTVVMSLFFSKNITGRLKVLADNAQRLALRRPLNQRLAGRDEIAELDHVFHGVANALVMAEKQKQEFVSMVSHDLRSPLSSLQANLEVMAVLENEGAPGQRLLSAQRSVKRMIALVNGLLDIDRLDAGMLVLSPESMAVESLADNAIESVKDLADRLEIKLIKQVGDVVVLADEQRLLQVIINLVSNAIKFSSAKGTITISAKESTDFVTISVTDQGRGIAPEQLDRIFERFQQVEKEDAANYQGFGLGLAICKALVVAHKGEIGASSQLGQGSTFWVKLPVPPKTKRK